MKNYIEILEFTKQIVIANIQHSKTGQTLQSIENLMTASELMFDQLYYINDVMTRMEIQDEEASIVRKTAKNDAKKVVKGEQLRKGSR